MVSRIRQFAKNSAQGIRALREPVRVVTHSGVKLTSVSHEALLGLLALQLDVVTSALSDAAAQLDRVAQADNVKDLVSGQADELRAIRERVVKDVSRAVAIAKDTGRSVRDVAAETVTKVRRPASQPKAKRAVRRAKAKTKARAKKTVRRAK
jgi:hypothetical protein